LDFLSERSVGAPLVATAASSPASLARRIKMLKNHASVVRQLASENPRRRWFRYSLRTLMVFILLATVPMSWLAVKMRQARKQRQAVEAIVKLGGSLAYDTDISKAPAPKWLSRLLGDDFFSTPVRVHFPSVPVTDADLEPVEGLTQLRELFLSGSQITDAGLERLKELRQLEQLDLSATQVTDAGLKHLDGAAQLQMLNLCGTRVTDTGMQHLRKLTQLRRLWLIGTPVTGDGCEHLKGLTQLEDLNLSGTRVTDAGLEHLQGMAGLLTLNLIDTPITDAGLAHLNGLTQLQELFLWHTHVSDEGVKRLQQALPNCKVAYK
jgi:hypothetical protein